MFEKGSYHPIECRLIRSGENMAVVIKMMPLCVGCFVMNAKLLTDIDE